MSSASALSGHFSVKDNQNPLASQYVLKIFEVSGAFRISIRYLFPILAEWENN